MSFKQAAQGTTHVVKSTASLDFFSNATKSTTTDSLLNTIDVAKFKRPQELKKKPRVMRSTVTPFHPFLNLTETYKLSLVTRALRASHPLTHEATMSNGKTQISNDFNFISGRDALEFSNAMREEYFELNQVPPQRPDTTVESIDERVAQAISQKLDNELTLGALSEIITTPLVNGSSAQVTLDEKVTYIIQKYLTPKTIPTMFKFIEHYISMVDNPQLAFRTFTIALNTSTKHGFPSKKHFITPLRELHEILTTTYPTLKEHSELQVSFLSTLLFYREISQAHEIMLSLEQTGHCPDSNTFARYLKLLNKQNNSADNIQLLTRLRGLDDTIFTTLDAECAQHLIPISRTIREVSSILDMLEMKYDSEQLRLIVPQIESVVCKTMRPFSSETGGFQGMFKDAVFPQKLGVLNRLAQYSPWTDATRLFIIEQAIESGAFILARQTLENVSLNKETVESLKQLAGSEQVMKLPLSSKPGQDPMSYQELISVLEAL